jgi:hypothetical protein
MKCCESPTTSTAVNVSDATRGAGDVMQAIIFSQILKPLTAALGPVGDAAVESLAQNLFMRPRQ